MRAGRLWQAHAGKNSCCGDAVYRCGAEALRAVRGLPEGVRGRPSGRHHRERPGAQDDRGRRDPADAGGRLSPAKRGKAQDLPHRAGHGRAAAERAFENSRGAAGLCRVPHPVRRAEKLLPTIRSRCAELHLAPGAADRGAGVFAREVSRSRGAGTGTGLSPRGRLSGAGDTAALRRGTGPADGRSLPRATRRGMRWRCWSCCCRWKNGSASS